MNQVAGHYKRTAMRFYHSDPDRLSIWDRKFRMQMHVPSLSHTQTHLQRETRGGGQEREGERGTRPHE